jgi:putative pyruvate formate lyase activating enzyme
MWRFRPDALTVLNDESAKRSLARYFAVMQDEKPAKFMIAKKLAAEFKENESAQSLWQKHDALLKEYCRIEKGIDTTSHDFEKITVPERSFLDLKIEIAKRILSDCHFCVRRCGVDRLEQEQGYCKCGSAIAVSTIFEHVGEEPELIPSGTIFTLGCTLQCKHCQNYTISQWLENGEIYPPADLAKEVERLRLNGCRNANLVGGEPTPWLEQWLETFKYVNVNVPVVWNSNSYYSPETARLLAGFVDVYLLDFKYGPSECAEKISSAPDYWETCTYNHLEAKKFGELIIRVLVLPDHLECCTKPIINWIAGNLGRETRVNIMFQYRPEWHAPEIPELRRRLTHEEMERAVQLAKRSELTNFIT